MVSFYLDFITLIEVVFQFLKFITITKKDFFELENRMFNNSF
ncbi:hypothetical protein SAMN04487762_2410 [Polaribacter sp. Hel1_33_78]|jgi:hypothetical protein|nr:hypothetical protein SAMN04487762_2410 [Polaribacter sp. Hel1_33_78]